MGHLEAVINRKASNKKLVACSKHNNQPFSKPGLTRFANVL